MEDDPARLRDLATANGINPDQHCCPDMAARIGLARRTAGTVPVLIWTAMWNEYAIGVGADRPHYYSADIRWERVPIKRCPWCGTRLPRSRREDWHRTLNALGFDDPGNQDVPADYDTDAWWRSLEDTDDRPDSP
jgi:hypothetical protein